MIVKKIKDKIEKIAKFRKDRRVLVLAIILMVAFSGGSAVLLASSGNTGNGGEHYITPATSISISISASQNPVDANMSVTFNASPKCTSSSSFTYKYYLYGWYPPSGIKTCIDSGFSDSFTYKFTSAEKYSVVWNVNSGGTGSATYNGTVLRDPLISASASTSTTEPGESG